jgi:hypothetical protein
MTDTDTDAERALWCAVIQQAIDDATANTIPGIARNSPNAALIKDRARKWLLGNSDDFLAVCELAGIEPRHIHAHAREMIGEASRLSRIAAGDHSIRDATLEFLMAS